MVSQKHVWMCLEHVQSFPDTLLHGLVSWTPGPGKVFKTSLGLAAHIEPPTQPSRHPSRPWLEKMTAPPWDGPVSVSLAASAGLLAHARPHCPHRTWCRRSWRASSWAVSWTDWARSWRRSASTKSCCCRMTTATVTREESPSLPRVAAAVRVPCTLQAPRPTPPPVLRLLCTPKGLLSHGAFYPRPLSWRFQARSGRLFLFSNKKTSCFFFLVRLFQGSFKFTAKLRSRYRDFL